MTVKTFQPFSIYIRNDMLWLSGWWNLLKWLWRSNKFGNLVLKKNLLHVRDQIKKWVRCGLDKGDEAKDLIWLDLLFCNLRSYHPNSHKASNKNATIAASAPIVAVMITSFNVLLWGLRCCSLWYEGTLMIRIIIIGIQSYSSY
jgi:hypothetical protein